MNMTTIRHIAALAILTAAVACAQGQALTKTGSLTASTQNVVEPVNSGTGTVLVQLAGTFTATVQFEATLDGTNYAAAMALPAGGGGGVNSATAAGLWVIPASGYVGVRARCSSYSSGTITVTMNRSAVILPVNLMTLATAATVSSLTSSGAVSGTSITGTSQVVAGANGQALTIQALTEVTTIAAAATSATTLQIPAGAIVLGVPVEVTTVIPTATTFTVTGTTSTTVFDTAAVSVAATTTDAGTNHCPYYNATAQTITYTMSGGTPAANTGRVRITLYYILVTPPTS
jgi:hypothetical protein